MPLATDKIEHIIVLMMENRSFDHMLGFMMSDKYAIDGLTGKETNPDPSEQGVRVTNDASASGELTPDPGHHYPDVNMQIFSNFEAQDDGGPKMEGFIRSYHAISHDAQKSRRIMKCFEPSKIPVLTKLAKSYAVCDRWFSSVPGPTLPNRSFIHSATSIGRVDMSPVWKDESKTIYELLEGAGFQAKIYYHDWSMAMTFKALAGSQGRRFGLADDFYRACKLGQLPAYSFVEPRYNAAQSGDQILEATDQHPDHNVTEGETLISDVYNAVRKSPLWEKSLLIVTYDEHGGLYDHVTPPATVNPDGKIAQDPGEHYAPDIPPFDFTRLGIRVPTVIISPYIEAGTIEKNVYDHTSILATARKILLKAAWKDNFLTERDRQANTFEHLLTRATARTDRVELTSPAAAFAFVPPLSEAQKEAILNKPLSVHQEALVKDAFEMEQTLPPQYRSGIADPKEITTERQASEYLRRVADEIRGAYPAFAGAGN